MVFSTKIVRSVREMLKSIGFQYNGELNLLKMSEDIFFLTLDDGQNRYLIEYSENGLLDKKYNNKCLLENNGINTGLITGSKFIIVYHDYLFGDSYRTAEFKDLENKRFIKSVAKWYKKLNEIKGLSAIKYVDYFSVENINQTKRDFNLLNNNFIEYVEKHFDNIKLKFDRLNPCFVIPDISIGNIVVSKENPDLIIVDFNELYIGNKTMNIEKIVSYLNGEMKNVFCEEYGFVNEDESIANDVVMNFVKLFLIKDKYNCDKEIKECLKNITSEKMYEKANVLVNWY